MREWLAIMSRVVSLRVIACFVCCQETGHVHMCGAWNFPCYFNILWYATAPKCGNNKENSKLCIWPHRKCLSSFIRLLTCMSLRLITVAWNFLGYFHILPMDGHTKTISHQEAGDFLCYLIFFWYIIGAKCKNKVGVLPAADC